MDMQNETPGENRGCEAVSAPSHEQKSSRLPSLQERQCFRVYEEPVQIPGGAWLRPGVYFHGVRQTRQVAEEFNSWVCAPLYIEAQASDLRGQNFGRWLRFRDSRGAWKRWCMPMQMVAGSGDEMRRELLQQGLEIDTHDRHLLAKYLQWETPDRHVLAATQTGWCQGAFVLPDEVIGGRDEIVFQSPTAGGAEYAVSGTLEGWQKEVAALAVGNPLLALSMSTGFAGPLLEKVHRDGGGVHPFGDSTTGKSTALKAAASEWGGEGYRRTWRGTSNGMEGAAVLFNDSLLALDEIGEADPREVGAVVYSLGNGQGKQRANRYGGAREPFRWRVMVLSTGERTLGAHMAEGGKEAKAGQQVRLLDIPVARKYGLFDELHGFQDGRALSDAIQDAVTRHHGHAGRAYLKKLVADKENDFGKRLATLTESVASMSQAAGQERRAAEKFALIALAGELATEYGVTGWPEGTALAAAKECFRLWLDHRGRGNSEDRAILERISDSLDRYGDSRFSSVDGGCVLHDRWGWLHQEGEDIEYLFSPGGLKEVAKGFDFQRVLDAMEKAGWLRVAATKKSEGRSIQMKIDGKNTRVYPVRRLPR